MASHPPGNIWILKLQKQYNKNGFKMLLQLFVHVVGSLSVVKHCKRSYAAMYSSQYFTLCLHPLFLIFLDNGPHYHNSGCHS